MTDASRVQLTILGGGGFRVPLVFGAILRQRRAVVREVVLYDVDQARLDVIDDVLQQMIGEYDGAAPALRTTTDLDAALHGATFVCCAIRVGGLEGRMYDEQVPLDLGLVGQETTGPGGIAFGLRTIPVVLRLAAAIAKRCPSAWVINFTNPAGMVTEAMQQVLGDRVIGICDSPSGLVRRAARARHLPEVAPDYVGLNHLGWLQGLRSGDRDHLPDLMADDDALDDIEEVRLFGRELVRTLGALPNEYLYYYYFTREAVAATNGSAHTRAEFLLRQQDAFYRRVHDEPRAAAREWEQVRRARSASYMADSRGAAGAPARSDDDVDDAGYEKVAIDIMSAIADDKPALLILNVRNEAAVAGLPPDAVVEVPCLVDGGGPQPVAVTAPSMHMMGLMQQVKAVEQLTIGAATTGSRSAARQAFALHPLVDSFRVAGVLLDRYCERVPAVADALPGP